MNLAATAFLMISVLASFNQKDETEKSIRETCQSVKGAKIYSNAYYVPEAGDVVGIEIAVFEVPKKPHLLFLYQGTPFAYPVIPLIGQTSGRKVHWSGKAIAKLIEYPSKRETERTTQAEFNGTMTSMYLRGNLKNDEGHPQNIRLKRVSHLWVCKVKK